MTQRAIVVLEPSGPALVHAWLVGGVQSIAEHRDTLLRWVAAAPDFALGLRELSNLVFSKPETKFKLVFPPGLLEGIERGELHWKEAKDGSGILPTLFDADEKFAKQVRVGTETVARAIDPAALANAAAHAQTHAMLAQIIAKLDTIEQKLDLNLAYLVAGWRGEIAAGIDLLKVATAEGDPMNRSGLLANSLQSLCTGQRTGLEMLKRFVDSQPAGKMGALDYLKPKLRSPSEVQAEIIDRAEEDFRWFYAAAVAKAKNHEMSGRSRAVRSEFLELREMFEPILRNCRDRFAFAAYSEHRRAFWLDLVEELESLPHRAKLPIAIDVSVTDCVHALELNGAVKT